MDMVKSFRYELYTRANESGTHHAVVFCDTRAETCKARNAALGNRYPSHVMDDLSGRLERPDPRNRWDSPLFTVAEDEKLDCSAVLKVGSSGSRVSSWLVCSAPFPALSISPSRPSPFSPPLSHASLPRRLCWRAAGRR